MATPASTRSIRAWKPKLGLLLPRASQAPRDFKMRVGQGVHLLLYGASEYPLHVKLLPANGEDGWYASARTLGRYTGDDEVEPAFREWLDLLRLTLSKVERIRGWSDFLAWAADKPGVSLPRTRPEERATSGASLLIRIHEPCNAACAFCSCIGVMPDYATEHAQIAAELDAAREHGTTGVTFTGGEPTLRRDLPEVVALAAERGFSDISMQTNAVRLGTKAGLAQAVRDAGLTSAFVSLHSHRAEVHDRLLRLDGAFEGAVRGVANLLDAGVTVRVNHVIQRENLGGIADFARFLVDRFDARVQVTWSFVSPIGWALEHLEVIPKLSEALPGLRRALATCRDAGMVFDVPGLCGMPMCLLPEFAPWFSEFKDERAPPLLQTRRYFDVCERCAVRDRCSGYWTVYADRFGQDEFVPLASVPGSAANV